jgi:hypothetical protein
VQNIMRKIALTEKTFVIPPKAVFEGGFLLRRKTEPPQGARTGVRTGGVRTGVSTASLNVVDPFKNQK